MRVVKDFLWKRCDDLNQKRDRLQTDLVFDYTDLFLKNRLVHEYCIGAFAWSLLFRNSPNIESHPTTQCYSFYIVNKMLN